MSIFKLSAEEDCTFRAEKFGQTVFSAHSIAMVAIMPAHRRSRKTLIVCAAGGILLLIWMYFDLVPNETKVGAVAIPYAQKLIDKVSPEKHIQNLDLSYLSRHVGSDQFTYARRTIKTKYYTGDRPSLTRVNESLVSAPYMLDKANLTTVAIESPDILELEVPNSPKVDLSTFSFGMSTKIPRLRDTIPQITHWLRNSGCQLQVIAPPHEDERPLEREIRGMGIDLTITTAIAPFPKAYFSILKKLYETRTPHTKWLAMFDDDTFVPSLPYLVQHFNKLYNPEDERVIAAMSDNIGQIHAFGLLPFGGGGIFVSVPLAKRLTEEKVWERCMASAKNQGDQIVNDCLNDFSTVRPTFDMELHQMDIIGDPSGYFESGRRLLTIHHWKSWFSVNVPMVANVSKACGDECVLQRWRFDGNTVLNNGYSINEYPGGIESGGVELGKVEKTWDGEMWRYVHKIGPLREPVEEGVKRSLLLVEANAVEGVGIRQVYVQRAKFAEGRRVGIDRVVELLWLF
jgi:Protein of unknown function, DUF604